MRIKEQETRLTLQGHDDDDDDDDDDDNHPVIQGHAFCDTENFINQTTNKKVTTYWWK